MSTRTYHDALHRGITLCSDIPAELMIMELIDSSPFQRLRRIRQLGPAFLTFHGAESSRFTHSLGVFQIARKALKKLLVIDPTLKEYEGVLYAAALLHDIGHAPLSHAGEDMFGIKHELWSSYLIKNHPEIKKILEKYNPSTAIKVADLIEKGQIDKSIIKSLISSQLDCDRLDYLIRDSYSTGTSYGLLDLERILKALTIAPDGDLAIHPKGLMAVEHYLVLRNLMYRSVYNHRINEICSWILEKIISLARELGPKDIWADKIMAEWLWSKDHIDINAYISNDDIRTIYHFQIWAEEGPKQLSEMCRRFINRDLLKAISIEKLGNELKLEALSFARQSSSKIGIDPDISCGIRQQKFQSYLPYKGGLRLWDGTNLQAIEKISPLIRGLINPAEASWLIYPKQIDEKIKSFILNIEASNKLIYEKK